MERTTRVCKWANSETARGFGRLEFLCADINKQCSQLGFCQHPSMPHKFIRRWMSECYSYLMSPTLPEGHTLCLLSFAEASAWNTKPPQSLQPALKSVCLPRQPWGRTAILPCWAALRVLAWSSPGVPCYSVSTPSIFQSNQTCLLFSICKNLIKRKLNLC